jgi:hypothetical protein
MATMDINGSDRMLVGNNISCFNLDPVKYCTTFQQ